ncbi:hypothetical protein EUX98_g215 [Antrodiella citrinella]|uniref:Uncharacterized protein n=1 Tax=Antrodiella citrinella TaxID=2447956 RepID=A0A4S4N6L6_9APHY|nr:hypothetical protein EUX98_g215 [Antrodiella citrinella]
MPASSYDYYEEASGSTSTDHAQSSSDSNHTPTPPVRYQPSQYFSDTVGGYSVNEGSPGALHHHQSPAAPDETGGGSFF